MRPPSLLLMILMALAAGCGGPDRAVEDAYRQAAADPAEVLPSNADVMAKIYDTSYTVPDGFYVDPRANTTRSYTIHHVLDSSASFELCSDNFVAAQALEEADNSGRTVGGYFVTSIENERYFEFVRELAYTQDVGNLADVTSPGFARIFKCSYVDREGVDRNLLSGYAGRLNSNEMDARSLQDFVEYLWQFRFFDVRRAKVIDSVSGTAPGTLQHTLTLAFLVSQGTARCDRIELGRWHFSADPGSGDISREFEALHSFEAKLAGGIPVFCD